jgi:glycosyltransferase involved in cell wall biosynthesis
VIVDVIGHFGSRLSYATVSEQLVRGLAERQALGRVTNLDDRITHSMPHGIVEAPDQPRAIVIVADPREYLVEMAVGGYGRENVAIFCCPNTDAMSPERTAACRAVGRVYTPSEWCAGTIFKAVDGDAAVNIRVMPLGVDEPFATRWVERPARSAPLRLLHVTTDTWWPGRKGTEELLHAWKWLRENRRLSMWGELTVHCLPQLYAAIYQELGDLGLLDDVKIITSETRGTDPETLFDLFAEHDLLLAPSRSEGFGIMPLSALVSGTPVLTTNITGQHEYLGEHLLGVGVLGGWAPIVTAGHGPLAGEDGSAPQLRADLLAYAIESAWQHSTYEHLRTSVQRNALVQAGWSWAARRKAWADDLVEWATKNNRESA